MARLDEKSFKKHISQKKFNNIYVIFGDEKYLVSFYTKELTRAVAGDEPSEFSMHTFSEGIELNEFAAAVGAVPFMSQYNCVLVSNYDVTKLSSDEYADFIGVLKGVPESTIVIFSYTQVPQKGEMPDSVDEKKSASEKQKKKRGSFLGLCKTVETLGVVAELNMRSATALEHQLVSWADKMSKKLSLPIASKIIYYCGTELSTLRLELEKLCAYAGDNDEITIDMVERIVIKNLEAKVYDMLDDVIYGNMNKAYTSLSQLISQGEEPRDILRLLGFTYIDLYRARVTVESGATMKDTAEFFEYKKRAWVLNKAQTKSARLSTSALRLSISEIINLSEKMNSVSMDEESALVRLIAQLNIIACEENTDA